MTHRDRFSPGRAAGPCWEAWYQAAAPEQRHQALALARQFGMVPARLLPSLDAGTRPSVLSRLLAGADAALDRAEAPDIAPHDEALDACQRRAVARALASPDVSLILGCAGTGKSRALAELLAKALAQGQRLLFASGSANGIFPALERLPAQTRASSLVLMGPSVPASLSGAAHEARREELVARAQGNRDSLRDAEARLDALRAQAEAAPSEAAGILKRLDRLGAEAQEPSGPAWATTTQEADALDAPLAAEAGALAGQREAILAGQASRQAQREHLAALAQARRSWRWWSLSWWRSLLASDVEGRLAELARKEGEAADALACLDARLVQTATARAGIAASVALRRAEILEQQREERRAGQAEALAEWRRFWGDPAPLPDAGGLASGLTALRARLDTESATLDAQRRWTEAHEQALPHLATMLLGCVPLVAGSAEALLAAQAGTFDLLVVEDAHLIDEETLLALAGRAARWCLAGEPPLAVPLLPGRSPARSAQPFHRLWDKLHADPRRLPCRWRVAAGRLVAALRPLAEARPGSSHAESVYDRPEIELRIASLPDGDPCVFEVSFPGHTPPHEAREFIYRELEELSIESDGAGAHWQGNEGSWSLSLSAAQGETVLVPLEDGVGERLVRCPAQDGCPGWKTAGIVFDRAKGWDRPRAEQWAESRLGLRDTGRTACLEAPRRAEPALARFLADCLHRQPSPPPPWAEFIPVPGLAGSDAPRSRSARGAGLEIDLAQPRRAAHPDLSPEALAALPAAGIVNPDEAQAVLAVLERDLADESFVAQALAWQQAHDGPAVAVLSCFPAQRALLRFLVEPMSRQAPVRVEVLPPCSLRGQGCFAVVASLVRSQHTQAVPFSGHPDDLALLLSRAEGRLRIVGDPGSMLRRGQWFGGLPQQHEAIAPHEQALLQALAAAWPERMASAFLAEPGKHSRSRESSSA